MIHDYKETMSDFSATLARANSAQSGAQQVLLRTLQAPIVAAIELIEVQQNISAIRRYWNEMVYADSSAQSEFSNAQSGLAEIISKADMFTNSLGKNGGNL